MSLALTAGRHYCTKTAQPGIRTAHVLAVLARAVVGVLDYVFSATNPLKESMFGAPAVVRIELPCKRCHFT